MNNEPPMDAGAMPGAGQEQDQANEMTEQPGQEAGAGMNASEQCVPTDALAMPDDGNQMTPPEKGDTVDYQVQGKVTRIEGGMTYVQPTSINGNDVEPAAEEKVEAANPEEQDQNDYAQLEDMAAKQGPLA